MVAHALPETGEDELGVEAGAAGAASVLERPVTLLLGDLAFLHDLGGLATLRARRHPFVIVVVQNQGGRIFEELPIGTYHLRIRREFSDDSTAYTLTLTPQVIVLTDPLDPGDTIATARDLGALTSEQVLTDIAGAFDVFDVYTFSLNQPIAVDIRE